MVKKTTLKVAIILSGALALSGCDDTNLPGFLKNNASSGKDAAAKTSSRTVERDVEAPEVFQMSETGLWDGRPTLGGVWVANASAKDPERVIIRNESNGKFVIGSLFRRERDVPGPRFQVSSDAAEALEMLAGNPANLSVTALRKEVVTPEVEEEEAPLPAPGEISEGTLDDPIAAASAALDRAEAGSPAAPAAPKPAANPAPKAPKPVAAGKLSKPFVQIGIFSVESNAKNTAEALRQAGMLPTIKPGTTSGKKFWRVIVGPTTNSSERSAVLKKVRGLGFADAYYVSR